jgi:hypothetical protein
MIFAIERGRDLLFESQQVINRQGALLATGQMIGDRLKLFPGQVFIDISSRLFRGQMRARQARRRDLCRFIKNFGSHGEECRGAVHSAFDLPAARFTLAKVIRDRKQFRNA